MAAGIIFDTKKYSLHDGPGIRTTVFFKGCRLHCPWCHNPESQSPQPQLAFNARRCIGCGLCSEVCPVGSWFSIEHVMRQDREGCQVCGKCVEVCYAGARQLIGEEITAAEAFKLIERDRPFYEESGGGVTISGGEPLQQPEFLAEVLTLCKQDGIHTALDTTGYGPWAVMEKIYPLVDLFLYDLKFLEDPLHIRWTGVSNHLILGNLTRLISKGARLIVRRPVLPGINDSPSQIRELGRYLQELGGVERVDLLGYHNLSTEKTFRITGELPSRRFQQPEEKTLEEFSRILGKFEVEVKIGG